MNVLVIEDDSRISGLLERGLGENGHSVTLVRTGREGVDRLLADTFDAALLDLLLPEMDGLSVLEHVRARRCKTAIMVLTALDAVPNILRAFDLGADDYVVKPFLLEVLLARLSAISRRGKAAEPSVCRAGSLIMDRNRQTVTRNGSPIRLNRKQFALLELLMRRNGLVTSREDLIEAGWGYLADVKGNTLDVYVHGLRAKLDAGLQQGRTMIRTVHGTGYVLQADAEQL